MFLAMSHWSVSGLSYQYWIFIGIPLGYPVVAVSWRSCSYGSAGLSLSSAVPVHRWGRWANSKPYNWAWVVAESVSPPALSHPGQQGISSSAQTSSPTVEAGKDLPHPQPFFSFVSHTSAIIRINYPLALGQTSWPDLTLSDRDAVRRLLVECSEG